ncbi:hypothetical protein [Paraburkholderia ultramafica]|nr:hypothetical protein [Paraburkholderia ultramafica]
MEKLQTSDAAQSDAQAHDVHAGDERCARGVTLQQPARWAWTAASGHYDWMDSQGPFVSLD